MAVPQRLLWKRKLKRIYDEQLRDLIINREIFRQANKVWSQCKDKRTAGNLAQWMVQNYLAFAATSIRRIAEPPKAKPRKGERTLSLVILLGELSSQNNLLSRQWYSSLYGNPLIRQRFAGRDFDRLTGRANASYFPKTRIRQDITAIRRATRSIKRLVDKVIAHTEEDRRRKGRQTWGSIDNAIDVLGDVFQRYYLLLNGSSFDPCEVAEKTNVANQLAKIWPQ